MAQRGRSARAAGTLSLAVFLSRILGLVRDQIFARLFGAGFYYDAWLVAFRIPNLLRDLFAEGAFSSAFVPTFTHFLHRKGRQEAWLLANLVISSLLVVLGGVTVLLIVFSKYFVFLFASGFVSVPDKVAITASLIRFLSPFLILVAMASVAMGILNTLDYYFIPALAPAFFNVAVIAAGLFLAPRFQEWGILPIYAMAAGALGGGLLQFLIQWPLLRKHGLRFRFRLNFRHPGIRKIARLLSPAIIGISAVQINILVNTQLASFLQDNGPVSWLSYAFRIFYLPIGLFGVAVGVVNLREVSVYAAHENWEEFRETVANSLKLVSLLAFPSALGLCVLAVPIVRLLFEHGDFSRSDTLHTAYALIFYSLGLFAYSCIKVYVPSFYALNDTRTPVRISIASVIANIFFNLAMVFGLLPLLIPGYEYVGLALGTTVAAGINAFFLARQFRRRLGGLGEFQVASTVLRISLASLLMAGAVLLLYGELRQWVNVAGLPGQIIGITVCIAAGAGLYFLFCLLLRVEEVHVLVRYLKRRFLK